MSSVSLALDAVLICSLASASARVYRACSATARACDTFSFALGAFGFALGTLFLAHSLLEFALFFSLWPVSFLGIQTRGSLDRARSR